MKKNTISSTCLAQAMDPRSSYRPSLRRDCQHNAQQGSRVLAWARPPRLR